MLPAAQGLQPHSKEVTLGPRLTTYIEFICAVFLVACISVRWQQVITINSFCSLLVGIDHSKSHIWAAGPAWDQPNQTVSVCLHQMIIIN